MLGPTYDGGNAPLNLDFRICISIPKVQRPIIIVPFHLIAAWQE